MVGYTRNGGTIYGDGRIVMANGQTFYPDANGQYPWGQDAYYNQNFQPSTVVYDYDRTGRWDSMHRHDYAAYQVGIAIGKRSAIRPSAFASSSSKRIVQAERGRPSAQAQRDRSTLASAARSSRARDVSNRVSASPPYKSNRRYALA